MTRVVLLSEVNSKFGAPILARLLANPQVTVAAVVTSPAGKLCDYYLDEPEPVDLAAMGAEAGVPVMRPPKVNRDTLIAQLAAQRPDYFIIGNYQQILGERLLDVPEIGTVNFHPSPLPRYAGLAPFFWMAKNNERQGGVSAVWTTAGIDAGPLVAQRLLPMAGTETAAEIRKLHFEASWDLFDEVLPTLIDRSYRLTPQDVSQRTYYGHPEDPDRQVELTAPSSQVLGTIRACAPSPGAEVHTRAGLTVRVLDAEPIDRAPVIPSPRPGELYQADRDLVGRTADGWLRITGVSLADGGLAYRIDQPAKEPVRVG